MNTTDKEKTEMNTALTTNQRLVTILLVLLIVLVALLIIGIVAGWLMMGGMIGWGGIMTNNMAKACADMMQNLQGP